MNPKRLHPQFKKLDAIIKKYDNFLLIIHPSPDADALGSSFALKKYIQSIKKKRNTKTRKHTSKHKTATIYSTDKPGKDLAILFNSKNVTTKLNLKKKDVIIILDRGDVYYKLGIDKKIATLKNPPKKIINIDHHSHTEIKTALNLRSIKAAATSEIIYIFFDYINFPINQTVAQYLLNGIYADTGGLKHNNTSPEVLEITGQLMRYGASISKVNRVLFANKTLSVLRLWGLVLSRAQVNKKTGMVVSFITKNNLKKYNPTAKDLKDLSEILNTISESKFSLMLTEKEENKIKASLRSEEYKKIDVSKIARLFKGGGHKLASGFEIKGKLKQTKDGWIIK